MVFSPIPAYLDRANWQQQPNHQSGSSGFNSQLPPPPPQPHVGGVGGMGSIRPGSMSDRARMANIPMPETALKCPRCESSNTKFCYFNNYSLTQPRHFCKTCRRYWTRGGALRNVPVGGGCRRNKRSKASSSSSSKSPVSGDRHTASSSSASTAASSNSTLLGLSPQGPPLRFMAPLHQLTDYGAAAAHHMGLNYSGIMSPPVAPTSHDMNYQIGNNSIGGGGSYLSAANMEQWRLQQTQIPLFPGLEGASGLYPIFPGGIEMSGYVGESASQLRPKLPASGLTQLDSVKMEETRQEMNLSRQFLGSDQYWSTGTAGGWTDLSGFNSPSTSNPL